MRSEGVPNTMRLCFFCVAVAAGLAVPAPVHAAKPAAAPPATSRATAAQDLKPLFGEYRGCFVLRDLNTNRTVVRYNPERCSKRFSPCSTYKIPHSLIALETGVASGPDYLLRWDGVKRPIDDWNHDLTLQDAVRVSAVWYFQRIAPRIGAKRMQHYLDAISYGNRDISGGITQFWLGDSLKISADEQVEFISRLQRGTLAPFSARNQATVREIIRQPPLPGVPPGAVLRGKTGTDGDLKKNTITFGWFVGTVERDGHAWAFAINIDGGPKPLGRTARGIAVKILQHEGIL